MIDKRPTGWADELIDMLGPDASAPAPLLHDRPSERVSELLGLDGEPLMVPIPRMAVGFDLRVKKEGE